ncbi:medium chain dehydrogenase/reductase family protein [candidate division CSSED10-310 bacterium]|uniref:Medium chain dehydrogenase/reductase family protein n=1 Tax=candidate division CSSED10-310 bacterium TaxID=2855610 RepID=A0ABV6YRK6_UNCC1
MKQIVITRSGGPEVLKIQEKDDPKPGPGKVLLKVKASGINFADILARKGLYLDAPKPPCVVGYEVSGIVEQVGPGCDETLVGNEVLTLTRFGGYSDTVTVPVENILEKPAQLSFAEAAALPVNYVTAYCLLIVMGSLKSDEAVLIHNAGGGVGIAALDIARQIGAMTYGTASPQKHTFLKERGLDHPIDYRNQDWEPILMNLTDNRGVELVIDPLGGNHWKKSYKVLRHTGRLGMFGVSTVTESGLSGKLRFLKIGIQMPWFNPISLMNSNKAVFGVNLGHLWSESAKVKTWFQEIIAAVQQGCYKPYVDKTFTFEEAGEAHSYIEQRRNIGKVVLVP